MDQSKSPPSQPVNATNTSASPIQNTQTPPDTKGLSKPQAKTHEASLRHQPPQPAKQPRANNSGQATAGSDQNKAQSNIQATNQTPQTPPLASPPGKTDIPIALKTIRLFKITSLVLGILILTNYALIFFTNSRTRQLNQIRRQVEVIRGDNTGLETTLQFLETRQNQIDLINAALPKESKLVDFVNAIEAISANSASSSSLEFSALAPTTTGQEKFIPFIIKLTTDPANFNEFLKKVEKLPYIVETTLIQAKINQTNANSWDYTFAARIYVQDPFKS